MIASLAITLFALTTIIILSYFILLLYTVLSSVSLCFYFTFICKTPASYHCDVPVHSLCSYFDSIHSLFTWSQVKIFGGYTRWAMDLPAPDSKVPAAQYLTTIDTAIRFATGQNSGPVHLNCQFRDPLGPATREWDPCILQVFTSPLFIVCLGMIYTSYWSWINQIV